MWCTFDLSRRKKVASHCFVKYNLWWIRCGNANFYLSHLLSLPPQQPPSCAGFGDYVPTFQPHQERTFGTPFVLYQLFILLWFITGMPVLFALFVVRISLRMLEPSSILKSFVLLLFSSLSFAQMLRRRRLSCYDCWIFNQVSFMSQAWRALFILMAYFGSPFSFSPFCASRTLKYFSLLFTEDCEANELSESSTTWR